MPDARISVEDAQRKASEAPCGAIIRKYLESQGYSLPSSKNYENITKCLEWYSNNVPAFHSYRVYDGVQFKSVDRERLGMAKVCCEDHANLLLNEKFQISVNAFPELEDIFTANGFYDNATRLVELAFALGTGAFVAFKDETGAPKIDYVHADMIFPISWDSRGVQECAFASKVTIKKKPLFYVQIHTRPVTESGARGAYVIQNVYLNDSGTVHTFDAKDAPNILPSVNTESESPLFWLIRPNTVNNVDLFSPLGISVYSNAFSQLRALDYVFDSYVNEFVLGKKRIMVPMSMATLQMQKDGTLEPRFDVNDAVFYAYQTDSADGKNELKEVDMTLRAADHDAGLQKMLDIFSKKAGLGTGYYKFENGVVRTATEVISTGSDLYRNRQKNIKLLTNAIKGLVNGLYFLSGKSGELEINIDFDDSIIEDATATANNNILLVGAGLRSKLRAIMAIEKCDEKEARKILAEIEEENGVEPEDDDVSLDGDAPNDGTEDEPPKPGDDPADAVDAKKGAASAQRDGGGV